MTRIQILVCLALTASAQMSTAAIEATRLMELADSVCAQPDSATIAFDETTAERSEISFRNRVIGDRLDWQKGADAIQIELLQLPARPRQTVLTYTTRDKPQIRLALDQDCNLVQARRIAYDDAGRAVKIEHLDHQLAASDNFDWLNPPLPDSPSAPASGPRIGLLDSGVNYLLPHIASRLARRDDGRLVGFDFWEMDDTPFDANPARSAFQVQRHGTRTASLLLAEAPNIKLVPYRYPRPDMSRMTQLVEHAAANEVRIIGMPLGSSRYADWADFARAAEAHPQILFIASAGNNGRDIDVSPVYPAGLEIDNLLVATSASDFVTPADRTNYGRIAVDYLLAAESVKTIDYDGSEVVVSGSSYAVPRLVALAARLLGEQPELTTRQLKARIADYAVRARTGRYVSTGFLPDPLADRASVKISQRYPHPVTALAADHELVLEVLALGASWSAADIASTLDGALAILAQCDVGAAPFEIARIDASGWLTDLATGPAHTIMTNARANDSSIVVVFAEDTRMLEAYDAEAFGLGNTANRPWLRNSVWLTHATIDRDIALAHELFHVITNSGAHIDTAGNLMQRRTSRGQTALDAGQCSTAIERGTELGVLRSTN